MSISDISQEKCAALIISNDDIALKSLATKILVGKLRLSYQFHPETLDASIAELQSFFKKNQGNALIMEDLKKVAGGLS